MKKSITLITSLCLGWNAQGQHIDSSFQTQHYQQRMNYFREMPTKQEAIVWLGDSITEMGEWGELFAGLPTLNRGIGGDNTYGVLSRLREIIALQPSKIFLLIGINDIGRGLPLSATKQNYARILDSLQQQSAHTEVIVQTLLPLNDSLCPFKDLLQRKSDILALNAWLKEEAIHRKLQCIDLYTLFADAKGQLPATFTKDGLHINGSAYVKWANYIKSNHLL